MKYVNKISNDYKHTKIVQVVGYLLQMFYQRGLTSVDKLKLIKMIWLADRINIRRNGMTITGDDYYAMKHGPVASRTLDIINQRRLTDSQIIAYAKHFFDLEDNSVKIKKFSDDFDHLSLAERHSLEKSFFTLLKFSSEDISTKSHQFPEWVKYKEHKKHGDKRMLIDKLDFFENPSEDYFAQGEEDALLVKYNKDAFVCNPLAE